MSKNPPLPSKKHSLLQNALNTACKSEKPPKHLFKSIPAFASPFPSVPPSRWENAHATFTISNTETGTCRLKKILVKQGRPEDYLNRHKLPLRFVYVWTVFCTLFQLHWFSSMLYKQSKPSFPSCLPVFGKALTGGANVEDNLERGGKLFSLLPGQRQQEEQ